MNTKKRIGLLFFTLFIYTTSFSQNADFPKRAIIEIDAENYIKAIDSSSGGRVRAYEIKSIPLKNVQPFMAVSVVWYGDDLNIEDATFSIGLGNQEGAWKEFYLLEEDAHSERDSWRHVSNLVFAGRENTQFRLLLRMQPGVSLNFSKIEVHFFNPGKTEEHPFSTELTGNRSACICPSPTFLERDQ